MLGQGRDGPQFGALVVDGDEELDVAEQTWDRAVRHQAALSRKDPQPVDGAGDAVGPVGPGARAHDEGDAVAQDDEVELDRRHPRVAGTTNGDVRRDEPVVGVGVVPGDEPDDARARALHPRRGVDHHTGQQQLEEVLVAAAQAVADSGHGVPDLREPRFVQPGLTAGPGIEAAHRRQEAVTVDAAGELVPGEGAALVKRAVNRRRPAEPVREQLCEAIRRPVPAVHPAPSEVPSGTVATTGQAFRAFSA